jgi:hypothetical protein
MMVVVEEEVEAGVGAVAIAMIVTAVRVKRKHKQPVLIFLCKGSSASVYVVFGSDYGSQ